MYIKKFPISILLLSLIFFFAVKTWAETKPVNLLLDGKRVEPGIKIIEKSKVRYINLQFLTTYFHIVADWDPLPGDIFLKFGNLGIKMYENNTRYRVNGGKRRLKNAPFEQDGDLWFPVEFILRLGLVVKNNTRESLSLNWAHNYLLAVENIQYQGRPAFLLIGSKELKVQHYTLNDPERLVITLPGFQAHFALESKANANSGVKKIRSKQIDGDHMQLVFDLEQSTGYQIIPVPDQPNQMMVVFNYLVNDISFQNSIEEKVNIKTSFPAQYEVAPTNEPNRLVVDFKGATLAAGTFLVGSVAGKWVREIDVNQTDPQTVRVTIDFLIPDPGFVIRSRANPNLIEVRRFQNINRIAWLNTDFGGKLIIESDGELADSIRKLRDPERLLIDLDYARFAPDLAIPETNNGQIKRIDLRATDTASTQIEVALNHYVGYTVGNSPDEHTLTINFMRSPLIGKTIVLDAGHGGIDLGALGRQGTYEKNINLEVVLRLKDLLEEAGAAVVLTRSDDTYIGLYERSFTANYLFGDLFISVHTNNHPDLSVHGIEVYYYKDRDFGNLLGRSILTKMEQFTGLIQLGVKTDDFVVIRESQMPGVLVELGFLSNFQEEATIKTAEFKENAAMGIFQGIMDYYQNMW